MKEETQLLQEETEGVGPPSTEDTGRRWGAGLGQWCDEKNQWVGGQWSHGEGERVTPEQGSEEARQQGRQKGRLWPMGVCTRKHTHTCYFGGFAAS